MITDINLKLGLDKINEGLDYFDKYIEYVQATRNPSDLEIMKTIGEVCLSYNNLCSKIMEIASKED